MRRIFAVAACVAAVMGLGAGSAFAGEVTGNGRYIAGSDAAPLKGKSACAYSGVNDNYAFGNLETDESGNLIPDADGFTRTQSWGQIVRNAGPWGGAGLGSTPNWVVFYLSYRVLAAPPLGSAPQPQRHPRHRHRQELCHLVRAEQPLRHAMIRLCGDLCTRSSPPR